jgi:hypothetical protein
MPTWVAGLLVALLNLVLPWIQSHASATVVAIVEEVIAFLNSVNQAGGDVCKAADDLLAHVKKVTKPSA